MKLNYGTTLLLMTVFMSSCLTQGPAVEDDVVSQETLLELVARGDRGRIEELFGLNTDINAVNESGQSSLHLAALANLHEIAVILLLRGANPNLQDNFGKTPLHYALEQESVEVLPFLVQYGADLFETDQEGRRPIHLILESQESVYRSVLTPYTRDVRDDQGNSPLHYAAEFGSIGPTSQMLSIGISPETRNSQELRPLDQALLRPQSYNHARVVELLVQSNAPPPRDLNLDFLHRTFLTQQWNMVFDQGATALHLSAARGYRGFVQLLLEKGANLEALDSPGNTPLHKAVEQGFVDIARYLLQQGANVNVQDFNGNTALHFAVTAPRALEVLRLVADSGADLNLKNAFGNSALQQVIQLELDISLLNELIRRNADVNNRNVEGTSPLLDALNRNRRDYAEILLQSGGSLFATNESGDSPISVALSQGISTLEWLITPQNIRLQDDGGSTVLHYAISSGNYPSEIEFLLDRGATVNDRNRRGETPLHLAVQKPVPALALLLLSRGANLFTTNNEGNSPLALIFQKTATWWQNFFTQEILSLRDNSLNTPLFHAVSLDNPALVRALLQYGADPNLQNRTGSTPLHEAVRSNAGETAEALLQGGALVSANDLQGNTPLHLIVQGAELSIGTLLIEAGASLSARNNEGRSPFHEAVRRQSLPIVRFFLQNGSRLNTRDNMGRTPLFDSIGQGNQEMVRFLLESGISVNDRDNEGNTPLHLASMEGRRAIIPLLLNNSPDLFAENARRETPIELAFQQGVPTLELLVRRNNVNSQNNQGNNVLHLAIMRDAPNAVIRYLISLDIDLEARNSLGRTAMDLAMEARNAELAQLLLDAGALPSRQL